MRLKFEDQMQPLARPLNENWLFQSVSSYYSITIGGCVLIIGIYKQQSYLYFLNKYEVTMCVCAYARLSFEMPQSL